MSVRSTLVLSRVFHCTMLTCFIMRCWPHRSKLGQAGKAFLSAHRASTRVVVPTLGVMHEGVGQKSAKWVNVGWPTVAGVFWLAEALWWHSDPFFGVLLILSVGMFTL